MKFENFQIANLFSLKTRQTCKEVHFENENPVNSLT